jgi:hypothetical protein
MKGSTMIRIWMAASLAALAGVVYAQAPAPTAAPATMPASKDGMMDCTKAGIYTQQCEESMRRKDPCYGKKDADLDACRKAQSTPSLRVRDCGTKSGSARTRCDANNARDREAAVAACGGKGGADIERCTSEKLSTVPSPQREARKTADKPVVTKPPATASVSKAGTTPPPKAAVTTAGAPSGKAGTATPLPAAATTAGAPSGGSAAAGSDSRKGKKSATPTGTTPDTTAGSTTGGTGASSNKSAGTAPASSGASTTGSTSTPTTK